MSPLQTEHLITRHWNAARTMLHRERGQPRRYDRAAGHIKRAAELSGRTANAIMLDMQLDLVTRRVIERTLRYATRRAQTKLRN